jgi:hypothetical protein
VAGPTTPGLVSVKTPLLLLQQFMSDVKGCHDSNALGTDNAAYISDFAHFFIKIAGGYQKIVLLVRRT